MEQGKGKESKKKRQGRAQSKNGDGGSHKGQDRNFTGQRQESSRGEETVGERERMRIEVAEKNLVQREGGYEVGGSLLFISCGGQENPWITP